MSNRRFKLKGKVHLYPGQAGWHFLPLPKKESTKIKAAFGAKSRGWGSLRVTVTIGKTSWKTSIFYDSKGGAYLLPLRADIRKKEDIYADDTVTFTLNISA